MSFLVDTDVLSELSKPRPNPKVDAWMETNQSRLYTSAITVGEITRGIKLLPTGARRTRLERWWEDVLAIMNGRILSCNARVAETWGELMAELEHKGAKMPLADSLIAAVAKRHNLIIATGNIADFKRAGGRTVNPFR